MKFITRLLLASAIMACCLLTSCGSVFTQDDAKAIGQVIVKESLAIGTQALSGAQVDPKIAGTQIGLKVANMALARATANMSKTSGDPALVSSDMVAAEADRIVKDAVEQAKAELAKDSGTPEVGFVAQLAAAGIGEKAMEAISPPDAATR